MDLFQTLRTPLGYTAAGIASGIKSSGANDMALFVSDVPATVAALFTTNRVAAAPVQVSRDHLTQNEGRCRAVVISSGNANAATGPSGVGIARAICAEVAQSLGCEERSVMIAQTGLIGVPLNRSVVTEGACSLVAHLSPLRWEDAARGMMTTDTHPKCSWRQFEQDGRTITVAGFAKGVAMAAPSMATMIVTILTDATVSSATLQSCLKSAAERTFHQLNIDGCRSTNDTVFCVANGAAGAPLIDDSSEQPLTLLRDAMTEVCEELALQMAGDAEGGTKRIRVEVRGAISEHYARRAARQIVGSVLVKCAIAGECPYWGRVIAEVGAADIPIDPENISIRFGDIVLCEKSVAVPFDTEAASQYLKGKEISITVELHQGDGSAYAFGSDLTPEYVRINMDKS